MNYRRVGSCRSNTTFITDETNQLKWSQSIINFHIPRYTPRDFDALEELENGTPSGPEPSPGDPTCVIISQVPPVMASPSGDHCWQMYPCPMCWYYRQLTVTKLSPLPGEVWYWLPTGTTLLWLCKPSFVPSVSWPVSPAFIESGAGINVVLLDTYIHQRRKCGWKIGVVGLEVLQALK